MSVRRAQVTFDHDSGLPEDVTVNTFHFFSDTSADFPNIVDLLTDFYTVPGAPSTDSVSSWFSAALAGTATIDIYDLADPEPRVPVHTDTFTFSPGGDRLPSEVAYVISWAADPESGTIPARRRGRTFLGPLSLEGHNGGTGRPHDAMRLSIARAGRDLIAAADASIEWDFVVFSPTGNSHAVITNGWIDNAFDTQRRRGLAPTDRTVITDSTP
jgi:hypothetical protein